MNSTSRVVAAEAGAEAIRDSLTLVAARIRMLAAQTTTVELRSDLIAVLARVAAVAARAEQASALPTASGAGSSAGASGTIAQQKWAWPAPGWISGVDRRLAEGLSLAEFQAEYVGQGHPVVIDGLGGALVPQLGCVVYKLARRPKSSDSLEEGGKATASICQIVGKVAGTGACGCSTPCKEVRRTLSQRAQKVLCCGVGCGGGVPPHMRPHRLAVSRI
jgi:hypothetical protein